jgi:8-oxo-dGTP pyrophosphatase MutT (NUDIX family)
MNDHEKNTWTTLKSEVRYETPWIKVTQYEVLNPASKPGIYGVVSFKNLAIGIIPIDENKNTWLVGQWRYPLKQYSWEIPEGGGPLDVDPLLSAQRELREETGLTAKKYTEICRMHLSNSVSDELAIIFVAQGLVHGDSEPEDTEDLQLKKIPFAQAYKMVMDGEITDSLSVAGIMKTKILMDEGNLDFGFKN